MKIKDMLDTFKSELIFERTPKGRSITQYGLDNLNALLSDTKNYEAEIIVCKNCGFISSSLLSESGCKNCGYPIDFNNKKKGII